MDYDNFKKMFPTPIGHQIGDVFIVILWSKWKSNLGKNMEAPDSFKNNPELDLSHYPGASYRALLRGGGHRARGDTAQSNPRFSFKMRVSS